MSSRSVSANFVLRNTSTVTWLRVIPDRIRDQEILLRPPRRSLATFRVAEESTYSPCGSIRLTAWMCQPMTDPPALSSERVVTTRALSRASLLRLSGWLGPALRLCSAERSTGPERAVTLTAGAVRCGLERPPVSLGRSTHDRACWGSLRSSSASAGRSGGQRLTGVRRR